jgi:peroxiredoxin
MARQGMLTAALALMCIAAPLAGATLPRPAPDFTISLTNGKQIQLSQYRGKVVVLAFILTTCSHCQRTTGYLNKLQAELGPHGLQVIESAIEENARGNVPGFVQQFQTPFPVGYNTNTVQVLDFLQHPTMMIPHMPLLAFIDRQGVIRAQHEGNEEPFFGPEHEQYLRNQIEVLLKEGAAPARKGGAKKKAASKKQS